MADDHPAPVSELPFSGDGDVARIKLPPHSLEAEQSVLGGLLLSAEGWDAVAEAVTEGDFYRPGHRLIFRQIRRLAEVPEPVDVITVADKLEARGELDAAGGLSYLAELAQNTPSASNIRAYAQVVRERSALRRLTKEVHDGSADLEKIAPVILKQLSHPKPEMRWAACWAMHDLDPGTRANYPVVAETFADCVDTCVLQLAKGPHSFRQRAAWLLGRYPEHAAQSVPALIEALQDPKAQRAAAEALGDLGAPAEPAIPALVASLRDPSLRKVARAALEKLGAPALAACREAHAALAVDDPKRYRDTLTAIVAAAGEE